MRLRGIRRSGNVEDRRGMRMGGVGGVGIVGVLAIFAISYFTGIDLTPLLTGQGAPQQQTSRELTAEEEQAADFPAQVLTTTEQVWADVFSRQVDGDYVPPTLVLFSDVTQSQCGGASGATGPFYCPIDRKAYLDLSFFTTLERQLGAEGDFAAAYVIAHEVAHHVQNLLGTLPQVNRARQQASETEANALTVRLELQADCYSGIWASHVDNLLEPGDIEEALNAARKIGDDHLQRQAGRVPQPHTFTHGTSEQRARWFKRGYDTGDLAACDTFNTDRL
mgnify:CR=1 FL=1